MMLAVITSTGTIILYERRPDSNQRTFRFERCDEGAVLALTNTISRESILVLRVSLLPILLEGSSEPLGTESKINRCQILERVTSPREVSKY